MIRLVQFYHVYGIEICLQGRSYYIDADYWQNDAISELSCVVAVHLELAEVIGLDGDADDYDDEENDDADA